MVVVVVMVVKHTHTHTNDDLTGLIGSGKKLGKEEVERMLENSKNPPPFH